MALPATRRGSWSDPTSCSRSEVPAVPSFEMGETRTVLEGLASSLALLLVAACGSSSGPSLTREELLVPETCMDCHPDHYREWSGSMHAYAADDPVFLAMNQRGQRETDGELGDFCVNCHAPMAVREGATTDGLDLDAVPQELKGVTCFFCHSVDAVEGDHNNPLRLADDLVLRGGIQDPVESGEHAADYSSLHDRDARESSDLCGACHDIVTPGGVHLERTFAEWKETIFGQDIPGQLSCSGCHMTGREGVAADFDGVPLRRVHEHTFAGVDVAVTEWPEKDAQLEAIARDLEPAILPGICVAPDAGGVEVEASLDNVLVGHMWPSGAAQDRRAWVELTAYSGGDVVYQSGVVPDGDSVTELDDPDLWLLRDRTFDEAGDPAHMFWEVADVESELLLPAVTTDPDDPRFYHAVTHIYRIPVVPDRITMQLHIQPIGLDVIDDLIASGDLAEEIRAEVPVFTLDGAALEWTEPDGFACVR